MRRIFKAVRNKKARVIPKRKSHGALLLFRSCRRSAGRLFCRLLFSVKGRVVSVEIFGIQIVLRDAEGVTEALIMHKLALAQKFDGLAHVGIVAKAQDVVIGRARLLLCCYRAKAGSEVG